MSSAMPEASPAESTNLEKYRSRNPVVRLLVDRYFSRLDAVVSRIPHGSVLDAGCGEGEVLERLAGTLAGRIEAVDASSVAVAFTAARLPGVEVSRQDVRDLRFADGSFDLALCLEVLEHLPDPEPALAELARVTAGDLVVSVPWEPWFRLGSLARGRYLRRLGDHPEHLQHWSRRGLGALLADRFQVVSLRSSFPWLLAHCRAR
jgi:2-polyprenyl-3-methyl-5-hydroxy-6-metoxy-1,4-benzoquinol methylase